MVLACWLGLTVAAQATIDATLQMQTGNPSGATADANNHNKYLIQRAQFAMDYNDTTREPNWVGWDLTSGDVGGSGRADFIVDTNLPAGFYRVLTTDYSGSGYDRGHMCPSADRTITAADNQQVFVMSNMIPQSPDNNQGVWASFETYCRTVASAGNEVLIISGPSIFGGSKIASGVAIPGYTWKIAVVVPLGSGTALSRIDAATRVIAIKIPNIAGVRSDPWQQYTTATAQIETDTGYTFFSALPASVAAALRLKIDGQTAVGSPAITTQPGAQSAAVGGSVTFSVAATGNTPLTYQWTRDETDIAGATSATFTLSSVKASDAGNYTVTVTNAVGSVTSNAAALVVTGLPPTITTAPAAVTASAGNSALFTVGVSGSPTLAYQWRKAGTALTNGPNIAGATTATLTLANVQAADAASYDVVVTNSTGSATSTAAALTVTPSVPRITTQPAAKSAAAGGTASFSIVAVGTTPLTYQWRKAGVNLANGGSVSGATTASLTLTAVAASDAGNYDVVVTNSVGSVTSAAAALTLNATAAGTISYAGGVYTQNFDGLPASGTFTLVGEGPHALDAAPISATNLAGWSIAKTGGTGTNALFNVGTGSLNTGSVYSYGAAAATDRALGSLLSGTTASVLGVVLTNNTGQTITQFTVSYNGEQWRWGGSSTSAVKDRLAFEYQVGGSNVTTGTFITAPALDFSSPTTSGTAGALDGNAAANRAALAATVSGLTWASGQTLVLRWRDIDVAGSDDGLAVDDFSFSTPTVVGGSAPIVTSTSPVTGTTGVAGNTAVAVTFNQPVALANGWFTFTSAAGGNLAATVTGGPTTFILTPPAAFAAGDTVTVALNPALISDQATGALRPAAATAFSFTTAGATPAAPRFLAQPLGADVRAGDTATFTVVTGAAPAPAYQWRKNGVAIAGATSASLAIASVGLGDAGSYDVVVTNSIGSAASAIARLAVLTAAEAPVITAQPHGATVARGQTATLTVNATGVPAPTFQWLRGGVAVAGATTSTLVIANAQSADAGNYSVVVTNSAGAATSAVAALQVTTRSYVGTYFGTINALGTFALQVRDGGGSSFVGFLTGSKTPLIAADLGVDDNGAFRFTTTVGGTDYTVAATITESGALSGTLSGGASAALGANRSSGGVTGAFAGSYQAASAASAASAAAIVSPSGQAFVLTQTSAGADAGVGSIDAAGRIAVSTFGGRTVAGTIAADATLTLAVAAPSGAPVTFAGAPDAVVTAQRFANVSTRATSTTGAGVTIAGLVITGQDSKPILLRAVGPGLATYGVAGFIARPRLQLYAGSTLLATNAGWSSPAPAAAEIAAAAARAGAFPFVADSADSALFVTLAPGSYSAVVDGADGGTGVVLVEAYDLSTPVVGQRLVNISTRAQVGTGDSVCIAGFVITGSVPKRILVRGVGPSLAPYGVTGVVAKPQLTLYRGPAVVAQNAGWAASADAAAIAAAAVRVSAFAFVSNDDAALLISLEPGSYSAVLSGVGGTTGIGLVEVYEVP